MADPPLVELVRLTWVRRTNGIIAAVNPVLLPHSPPRCLCSQNLPPPTRPARRVVNRFAFNYPRDSDNAFMIQPNHMRPSVQSEQLLA